MKLKWKPILVLSVVCLVVGLTIVVGVLILEHQIRNIELNYIGFEVTRVEVDTVYGFKYSPMFKVYFYIEHDGKENRVQLKLYKHEEHGDATIDSRFWNIENDTKWVSMQFYKEEDETSLEKERYRFTAQRTEIWNDEPVSNEITVWDGKTSNLVVLPFKHTFGIEVTKVEIGKYSTYEAWGWATLRNYTLRFYIFNHEEAGNWTFELYREFYDEYRLKSSEVTDSCSLYVEHGDAGYIELKAGALEEHEPALDLRYYRLKADALPEFSGTVWYGIEEEPFPV